MTLPPLPPLVGPIENGSVTWERLSDINYTTVGYLLCCHLVLENYLEAYIQVKMGKGLSVEGARLTFAQKVSMLDSWRLPENYNFMPSLKHLNALRNKLGHNIRTTISEKELLPLIQFVETIKEAKVETRDAISILGDYTSSVGAFLASAYVNAKEGPRDAIATRASFEKWGAHLD